MGKDKIMHFGVCFLVTLFIGYFDLSLGIGLSIGLAIGKEYGDLKSPVNKFDWFDIIADVIGIILGIIIILLIKELF